MKVGEIVQHPDGRCVKITGGQYWGEYGGSNWWYWRPVLAYGMLGPEECGYGWRYATIIKARAAAAADESVVRGT